MLALNSKGCKKLLNMYISKSKGANFWLGVLTNLQSRGVQDILIACVDGLERFPGYYGIVMHSPWDPQFHQVCGKQESARVHEGLEAGLSGGQ